MARNILADLFTPAGKDSPVRAKVAEAGLATAGQIAGTALATRKTAADKENILRIEELQRLQEMNALGLTDQERALLEGTYAQQIGDIGREGELRRRQQMASYDQFGGMALQQAALTDEATSRAQAEAAMAVEKADIEKRAQQEAELLKRSAIEGERQAGRRGAYGKILAEGVGALASLISEKREEEGVIDPVAISMVKEKYGMASDKEAEDFIRFVKREPEMAKILGGTL